MPRSDFIVPGTTAKLLEGHGLHECQVTGQQVGFVSIKIGGAVRLVRRGSIYVLPQERRRLQEDLQNSINHLSSLQDEVALMDDSDPTEQMEDDE